MNKQTLGALGVILTGVGIVGLSGHLWAGLLVGGGILLFVAFILWMADE